MIELVKGTIEHVPVHVKDRDGELTDLGAAAPVFWVRREADPSDIVIAETAADLTVPAGMTAHCLINTTPVGIVPDRYELLLRFSNMPEQPVLGPFDFMVIP